MIGLGPRTCVAQIIDRVFQGSDLLVELDLDGFGRPRRVDDAVRLTDLSLETLQFGLEFRNSSTCCVATVLEVN